MSGLPKERSSVNGPFGNLIPKMQTRDKIPRKLRSSPVSARASLISPSFHGVAPLTGTRAYLHFGISTRFTTLPTSFLSVALSRSSNVTSPRISMCGNAINYFNARGLCIYYVCIYICIYYITVVGVNTRVNNNNA